MKVKVTGRSNVMTPLAFHNWQLYVYMKRISSPLVRRILLVTTHNWHYFEGYLVPRRFRPQRGVYPWTVAMVTTSYLKVYAWEIWAFYACCNKESNKLIQDNLSKWDTSMKVGTHVHKGLFFNSIWLAIRKFKMAATFQNGRRFYLFWTYSWI